MQWKVGYSDVFWSDSPRVRREIDFPPCNHNRGEFLGILYGEGANKIGGKAVPVGVDDACITLSFATVADAILGESVDGKVVTIPVELPVWVG